VKGLAVAQGPLIDVKYSGVVPITEALRAF